MQYVPAVIFAFLFIIMAICFWKGKCLYLISGFNTMSKEEKQDYDISALSKFLSKILLGLAICLLVFDFAWYMKITALSLLSWLAFVLIIIFALV